MERTRNRKIQYKGGDLKFKSTTLLYEHLPHIFPSDSHHLLLIDWFDRDASMDESCEYMCQWLVG
jgi:hypothetical protein